MKHLLLLLSLFCSSFISYSQCDFTNPQEAPLSHPAFKKMMREHFGFTILGSQTPVTGFKLETAKPTITIKGNIVSSKHKAFIMNLELTAGVQENVMQLFSGSELNSFFKFNLGGNFIIDKANSARFLKEDTIIRRLTKKKVCQYRDEIEKTMDTFLVLKAFIQHSYTTSSINQIVSWITLQAQSAAYNLGEYTRSYLPSPSPQVYYDSMVVRMMNKYASVPFTYTHSDNSVNTFLTQLLNPTSTLIKVSTLLEDYTRLLKFEDPEDEVREEIWKDYQIETYRNVWAKKRISWVNISFMGSNSSFKMFNPTDSTLIDSKSFLPGISLSFNYLSKYKEATRFFYLKATVDFQRVNSLRDMPKFDYKKETVIKLDQGETLKYEKAGVAYDGTFKHGFGYDIYLETYIMPWVLTSIPGLYLKPKYSYGSVWLTKEKLSLDLGLVWNVTNGDKEAKNLLSIVPYVNWGNFMTEYKDSKKLEKKTLGEQFSVALRFGIPINIGK